MKLRQDIYYKVEECNDLKSIIRNANVLYDRAIENKYTEEFKRKLANQIIDSIKFIYNEICNEAAKGNTIVIIPMNYIESAYNNFSDDTKYPANSEGYNLSIPYILEYFTKYNYSIQYFPGNNPNFNKFRISWEREK